MTDGFGFNTVPCIDCGPGKVAGIGAHCDRLGISKLMVVTDPGLVQIGPGRSCVALAASK